VSRTLRRTLLLLLTAAAVLLGTSRLPAYPEPAIVSKAWAITFTYSDPRPVSVRGADGQEKWYWCLPYKIVNSTDKELYFVPDFTVVTDDGRTVQAGMNMPAAAFAAAKRTLGNSLLEDPVKIVGKLLPGADNAKECVAMWPDFSRDVNQLTLFVGGLSGETQLVKNPDTGAEVMLTKTLMLEYELPGQAPTPEDQPIVAKNKSWVMRETGTPTTKPKSE
jgi:hypothetical protein